MTKKIDTTDQDIEFMILNAIDAYCNPNLDIRDAVVAWFKERMVQAAALRQL
jgi:hypothetical protein